MLSQRVGSQRRVRLGWEALGTLTMLGTLVVIVLDPVGSAVRAVSVGFVLALMVATWIALGRVAFDEGSRYRWWLVGTEGLLLLVAVALDVNAAYLLLAWSFLAYAILPASWSIPLVIVEAGVVGALTHLLGVPTATIVAWYVPDIAAGTLLAVFLERMRQHEILLRRTIDELRDAQVTMRKLAFRMGELHERERVAARIHETIAQHLVGIRLLVRGEAPSEAARLIEEAAAAGLEATRSLIGELRRREESPEALGDVVLVEAARLRAAGVEVDVQGSLEVAGLAPAVLEFAQAVLKEATTNVLRHAVGVRHVTFRVGVERGMLEVGIRDDGGSGEAGQSEGAGLGLAIVRERAEWLGGTATAGPRPGGGFELTASVPLRGASLPEAPVWSA